MRRLLLAEILDGGNFDRHFTKYAGFTHQSMGKKYFLKIWRNMHFVRYYPGEALCLRTIVPYLALFLEAKI